MTILVNTMLKAWPGFGFYVVKILQKPLNSRRHSTRNTFTGHITSLSLYLLSLYMLQLARVFICVTPYVYVHVCGLRLLLSVDSAAAFLLAASELAGSYTTASP